MFSLLDLHFVCYLNPMAHGHTPDPLRKRMLRLGIREEDLLEKFILGSGSGGQKINKTSSCVYLKHIPTGIEVKCQQERSRELNRQTARYLLCNLIENKQKQHRLEKQQAREKNRREKRQKPKHLKVEMIATKKKRSATKSMRKIPRDFD